MMTTDLVRCPYCVLVDDFQPMRLVAGDLYICDMCGHMNRPEHVKFECPCVRCENTRKPLPSNSTQF
jgi:hypothetical protein